MLGSIRRWRNRWLGSPERRDRLARGMVGRRIADRHAERLFATITGFASSQMIAGAMELGVFDRLAQGPLSIADLASAADLPPAGARALAASLEGAGLCERQRDGSLIATVDALVLASDDGIRAMIEHHRLLYRDLTDPAALLCAPGSGRVGAFWPYRGGGDAVGYGALMRRSATFAGQTLVSTHDFGRHRHVMDVGGGEGALVAMLAARWPALALTLVDLPDAIAAAQVRFDASERVEVRGCAANEALPAGADAVTLVRVLHDHDDAAAAALLARIHAALPIGGTLIVAEPTRRAGRDAVGTYFAAYFAAMGSGRLRSPEEIRRLCRDAGFRPARGRQRRFLLTVLTATKR